MRAGALAVLFSACVFGLRAQVQVSVLDAEKLPLPCAHVVYTDIAGNNRGAVVTDRKGKAVIPMAFTELNPEMVLCISYIGFEKLCDTIGRDEMPHYSLRAEEQSLNEVVVTAQYAPNSPEKAVHKIRIIDERKIERMAAVNLEDVLSNELNIRIAQDNILGSSISMQGVSGENVKVMIDGVPMIGRQNGNLDLAQVNLHDVERIEIVEGPLSVNYGTNALAGTINIITKKHSAEKTTLSLTSYNESTGTYNLAGTAARQLGKARLSLSGGRNYFDGWNPGEPITPDFSRPVADTSRFKSWKPREQFFGRAQAQYQYRQMTVGYRFEFFDEVITNRGLPRQPYRETAFDDYYHTTRTDNAFTVAGKLSESLALNLVAAHNFYERTKSTFVKDLTTLEQRLTTAPGDQDTSSFGLWMSRGSLAWTRDSSWWQCEVGYDLNHERALGKRIENNLQHMGDYALFATAEATPFKQLTIRPGLRYAYNTAYRAPVVPSLNLRYMFRRITVRASYARGFRAPSLKELYFYFVDINHNIRGNEALQGEYAHNYSASVKYKYLLRQTIIQVEANGFYNDIRNLITLAQVEGSEYSYVNIGFYRTKGLSIATSVLLQHWKINLGVSYTGRYNSLSEITPAERFNYYPEINGNVQYDLPRWNANASLFYKYQGKLPGYSLSENGTLNETFTDGYHTADFTFIKSLWDKRISIGAGVKNLFNVQNVNASPGSSGAHTPGGDTVPVSTGRLYFLKLDFNWKK